MFFPHLKAMTRLALWVIISVDDILKYFSYFFQKIGFDSLCKLYPLHEMSNLLSAELAQQVVKVNYRSIADNKMELDLVLTWIQSPDIRKKKKYPDNH